MNYSGIIKIFSPILSLLFSFEKNIKRIFPTHKGTVVVIALLKLGDTVFTIPAIKEIIKRHGQIAIICYPASEVILKEVLDAQFLSIQPKSIWLGRIASFQSRRMLKKVKPGLIYDLTGAVRSATLIRGINAQKIIGSNEPVYKALYSDYHPINNSNNLISMYLDYINFDAPNKKDVITSSFPVELKKIDCIIIHPFAGWQAKEWNFKKFIELAENLAGEYKCEVVTESGRISGDVKDYLDSGSVEITETSSVEELVQKLKEADLVVGNDSGPVNIARMLGKPTFTVFGPTNPYHHLPSYEYHHYAFKKLKCSPNGTKYCFTDAGRDGCPAFQCMDNLDVDEVEQGIRNLINKINSGSQ